MVNGDCTDQIETLFKLQLDCFSKYICPVKTSLCIFLSALDRQQNHLRKVHM